MGCNCGGRSGSQATGTAGRAGGGVIWRHTDQYGGVVPYRNKDTALAGLRRSKGRIEKVQWGTGATSETIHYEDLPESHQ